jgi:hypothetical protein
MNSSLIDEAILAASGQSWSKVAMVIARVEAAPGSNLPEGEGGLHVVADRIEAFASDRRLVPQGDIKRW